MQRAEWAGTLLSGEKSAKDGNDRLKKTVNGWRGMDLSLSLSAQELRAIE